jgi:NhaP-type Na+/H+ or K+/H+ antiporter
LNTLFGLGIFYTFKTWLAALVLGAIISPTVQVKKS